ncbi:MAG TPA: hypothetical protein VIU62_01795 [Chloroflexota bacterium]|jgi:hypothetical protein
MPEVQQQSKPQQDQKQGTPLPTPAPSYSPPPSPAGLFYYAQKNGNPDLTTPATPERSERP